MVMMHHSLAQVESADMNVVYVLIAVCTVVVGGLMAWIYSLALKQARRREQESRKKDSDSQSGPVQ